MKKMQCAWMHISNFFRECRVRLYLFFSVWVSVTNAYESVNDNWLGGSQMDYLQNLSGSTLKQLIIFGIINTFKTSLGTIKETFVGCIWKKNSTILPRSLITAINIYKVDLRWIMRLSYQTDLIDINHGQFFRDPTCKY